MNRLIRVVPASVLVSFRFREDLETKLAVGISVPASRARVRSPVDVFHGTVGAARVGQS